MRPSLRGDFRSVARERPGLRCACRPPLQRNRVAQDVTDLDIDEELLEFLEADLLPEAAHPLFKTQLREYLRAMLRAEGKLKASGNPERGSD